MLNERGDWACLVCFEPEGTLFRRDSSDIEGTRCESSERCDRCLLYAYDYAYGNSTESVGFVTFERLWSEDRTAAEERIERELRNAALAEARHMWNDTDYRDVWLETVRRKESTETDNLVFADWCDDNGCPLNAEAVRKHEATRQEFREMRELREKFKRFL